MRRFSCSQDARAAPADRAARVVPACRVPPRPVRLQPSRTRRPPEPQPVTVTGPPAPRVYLFHALFLLFSREGSRPHFVRPYSLMYSLLILHHSSSRHTQSNTDTTSTAPLAPSYYAPPSTITVHRFLRLRGRGCIRRNLCIREGVRIHTRCVYAPRARVNAPPCVYAPTCVLYAPRCANAPAAYTHPPPRTSTYA
jgi:hypothetical protein